MKILKLIFGSIFIIIFFQYFSAGTALGNNDSPALNINLLQEKHPAYKRLLEALEKYQKIKDEGGWPEINLEEDILQKGDSSEVVKDIKKRLAITGDYSMSENDDDDEGMVFNEELEEAVENFQSRHGLQVDGIIGPGTVAKLNIPVEEKIENIKFSLESWENLPDDLGEKYIFVNIPEFRLQAYEKEEELLNMKIVAGDQYDGEETPTFNDSVEYVIFNPYWNVPHSIVLDQILPKAREDFDYLDNQNFEIVNQFGHNAETYEVTDENLDKVEEGDLLLRQKPGLDNSMGQVKFMFPNQHAIYLHDTPENDLFDARKRTFSNGCIRVEKPVELSEFLLKDNAPGKWNKSEINKVIESDEWKQVNLEEKIPVYIIYWTAFVDEDGVVNFRENIYNEKI